MRLLDALIEAADDLDGVDIRRSADGAEFLHLGVVVATVAGDVAEFRLATAVAAAALRTPDTRPSAASRERIAFGPSELDRYAIDRATAWLGSAARHAAAR